ncbi:hypothetical protein ACSSS7_003183 [Eimeria intestinalis]
MGGSDDEPLEGAVGGAEEPGGGASEGEELQALSGAEGGGEEEEDPEVAAEAASSSGGRRMSPMWEDRVRRLCRRMKESANNCAAISRSLSPGHAIELVQSMAQWAAVEISALVMLPDDLQPMRAEAGLAFVNLVEKILTSARFDLALHRKRCSTDQEARR